MREEDIVCVGSDGLQYCKVCGEAKEAYFPKGGFMGMKKHSRQCACDRKSYEAEQKYFKDIYSMLYNIKLFLIMDSKFI